MDPASDVPHQHAREQLIQPEGSQSGEDSGQRSWKTHLPQAVEGGGEGEVGVLCPRVKSSSAGILNAWLSRSGNFSNTGVKG